MANSANNRDAGSKANFGDDTHLGHDMALSIAEALLNSDARTVAAIDAALAEDPADRRVPQMLDEVVSRSVFGQAEPAISIADGPRRGVFLGSSRSAAITGSADVATKGTGPLPAGARPIVIHKPPPRAVTASPGPGDRRSTVLLSLLFLVALAGSIALTFATNQSDASVGGDVDVTEPTVRGVTTVVAAGETDPNEQTGAGVSPTTSLAPTIAPTTAPTTVTTATPTTTEAPTTTPSTAAPTTQAPTTQAPTTRAPTTRRPATTRQPATTARPVTTQLTIPDLTFPTPTWLGTGEAP